METTIKVTLVEDHPSYRRVIERALSSSAKIELTSMYGAAESALQVLTHPATTELPDIILLDLNLPGISGLDSIESFIEAAPSAKIIVLTQSSDDTDVRNAIRLGAQGYLLKSSTVDEIIQGIDNVSSGEASIDRGVAAQVLSIFYDTPKGEEPSIDLSSQEQKILLLLSQGADKQQIAEDLELAHEAVSSCVEQLYKRLEVQNATDAIDRAYRSGALKRV